MNCPKCGSEQDTTRYFNLFRCGSHFDQHGKHFHSGFCKRFSEFRKPLDAKIEELESHIKRIEQAVCDMDHEPDQFARERIIKGVLRK